MSETVAIQVQRYRCQDGKPTCCRDHGAGETCRFLGSRIFGTMEVCMLGANRDLGPRGTGYCRPDAACEIWKDEK